MNPSAQGWIPKFLTAVDKQQIIKNSGSLLLFYDQLKTVGFLYGNSAEVLINTPPSQLNMTKNEYTKINLFLGLLFTFFKKNSHESINKAIDYIILFYRKLDKSKLDFLNKFSTPEKATDNLEQILAIRLQENNSFFNKKNNSIFTYSLLFIDILAFNKFLNFNDDYKIFIEDLEKNLINLSFLALKSKKNKDKYDKQIINQIETSSVYLNLQYNKNKILSLTSLDLLDYDNLEKKYLFDIGFLAVWNDKELDQMEHSFLIKLANKLQLSSLRIKENIDYINTFSEKYSKKIKLFEYQNPLNHIYKESTSRVKLLIERNKKRLLIELEESGELMKLLSQSTYRELTKDEKIKVREQLLDICKTIPSLTIFLIPGGSLLLPILIKYIPSLLPSAFNENKIDYKS